MQPNVSLLLCQGFAWMFTIVNMIRVGRTSQIWRFALQSPGNGLAVRTRVQNQLAFPDRACERVSCEALYENSCGSVWE